MSKSGNAKSNNRLFKFIKTITEFFDLYKCLTTIGQYKIPYSVKVGDLQKAVIGFFGVSKGKIIVLIISRNGSMTHKKYCERLKTARALCPRFLHKK